MKKRLIIILVAAIGLLLAGRFMTLQPEQGRLHIELRSDPYPLVIGWTRLFFAVLDENGSPVDAPAMETSVEMVHEGMLPLYAPVTRRDAGRFEVPVVWSMSGQWMVTAVATLPDGRGTLNESFEVYVYPAAVTVANNPPQFRSNRENQALINDPQHERVIIIPQGTRAMLLVGIDHDIIPIEIRLTVSGQNTLIIQNNDLFDHVVGPFTIRAGEMIRQEFTAPNVFVGVCSVNTAATVSIIVED